MGTVWEQKAIICPKGRWKSGSDSDGVLKLQPGAVQLGGGWMTVTKNERETETG